MILLTGATSAIGRRLVEVLRSRGIANGCVYSKENSTYRFGDILSIDQFKNATCLIHLAWSREGSFRRSRELNTRATEVLTSAASACGIPMIFVSSAAVYSPVLSHYGAEKMVSEEIVLSAGGVCVQPGLVWNSVPAGAFKRLLQVLSHSPLSVKVNGESPKIQLVHLDDLVDLLIDTAAEVAGKRQPLQSNQIPAFSSECVSINRLYECVGRIEPQRSLYLKETHIKTLRTIPVRPYAFRRTLEQVSSLLLYQPIQLPPNPRQFRDFQWT